jgi:alpha-L-fucosidase
VIGEKTPTDSLPFPPTKGSRQRLEVQPIVLMALALGAPLWAATGCSSSVNVLSLSDGPPGVDPLSTPRQIAYQRAELTAFLHFGLQTFDGTEYGDAAKDAPSLFNPTSLDAKQWVKALQDAGFRQVTLVVKHSTGFCLWPSAYTNYSVTNSPWKNGQGDVVKEFTTAARDAKMRIGFYLSPWDENYPSSSPGYETYFRNQVTELLKDYGPIDEIQWNGFNAPASVNWSSVAELAHSLQPDLLVWMGAEIATAGADLRYVGNQKGEASRSTSSIGDVSNGGPSNAWFPAEAPVSERAPSWFWHQNGTVMSLHSLQSIYFTSVGMNTTLLLNVPPASSGLFDDADLSLLQQFGTWYASLYQTNLAKRQPAKADSTWADPGFDAAKAVDDDVSTYWAAARSTTSARLEVTPASAITLKVISIREPIELGERATAYHVEIKQNGTWNTAPSDASGARIQGKVIGQRQLWQLNSTTADTIALVIDSAKDVPAIAEFSVY